LRKVRPDIADIGRPLFGGGYVANKVTTIARNIEYGSVLLDISLEEGGDFAPDRILRGGLGIGKPLSVDVIEELAHAK